MYKFKYREKFPCEPKMAFEGTTTKFAGLEKYIPNVTKIEVLEQETRDDGVYRWLLKFYGDGAIPLVARSIVKSDMLRWNEELICDPNALTIEWKIQTFAFKEHVHCGGKTTYKDAPGGSELTIDGYLDITITHLPGLPDSLVIKAVGVLEPFLGKFIAPNLGKFYSGCKKLMKDRGQLK